MKRTDIEKDRHRKRQTEKRTDRENDTQKKDRQSKGQTEKRTDRKRTDRQKKDTKIKGQTELSSEREKDTQREREKNTYCLSVCLSLIPFVYHQDLNMTATQLWAGLAMETLVRHYYLLLSLSLFVF